MSKSILVLDNVRSAQNVGVLLRSADGMGLERIYACGLTPHPRQVAERRLPHVIAAAERKLAKTALGAEQTLKITYAPDTAALLASLAQRGHLIVGLEQTAGAVDLSRWRRPDQPLALVVGNELDGLSPDVIKRLDTALMIPMRGQKESLNVAVAGSIAMFILSR